MRHLAFRFVRQVPNVAKSQFVLDPYLDYRDRLNGKLAESLKRRKVDVDFDALKRQYSAWWSTFGVYNQDPSRENKDALLDHSSGLTDVLQLPNIVTDLEFVENAVEHQDKLDHSGIKNAAELDLWLSEQCYTHFDMSLPTVVRQSPQYRVRPVLLDACNLSELDYPRIVESNDYFTSLVGVSLPAQLAPFAWHQFTSKNSFPLNFIAIGASYRRLASSKVKQQTSASILNVNKSEEDVNQSFQSLANAVSGFLRRLDVPYVVEKKRPEDLTNFEAAGIVFRSNESCLANVSAIGSYISERLNVGLDLKDDGLRFAPLCHANIYLDGLLNK